jgi:glutamate synthase (NADPH/NADH) small chain
MNKSLKKVKMPELDPEIRVHNFEEVSTGYTMEQAVEEANRCLDCKNPKCIQGCPVSVKINDFIRAIKEKDMTKAYRIIQETNAFPSVCGRVCPQESQCEAKCILGIKGEPVAIGRLERFVGDWFLEHGQREETKVESNGIKVAVVGSGPVGLSCANDLAKMGYDVTIFEILHRAGGVLSYGIPSFRLPKDIVNKEIEALEKNGVQFSLNTLIGRTITIEELKEQGFQAIFIGSGAGLPKFMRIKGENSNGVFSANEILTRVNLMKAVDEQYDTPIPDLRKVMVVGGGNVAMDAARVVKRMGAEVHIVYRRSMDEMPARWEEIEHAKEEGIIFDVLMNPVEIIPDENYRVKQVILEKMLLGEPDEKGRMRPIPSGEFQTVDFDCVIIAVGTTPNPLIRKTTPGLDTTSWGGIVVNEETMETSIKDIYAGGDAVSGAATVISALGAGKRAAKAIDESLRQISDKT